MRKSTLTKILSLIIIVGMLFSIAPITARAENLPQVDATVSGTVYDGGVFDGPSHGYPLYAKVTVTGPGGDQIFYTDPFDGSFEVTLETDVEYTIKVEAQLPGYITYLQTHTFGDDAHIDIYLYVADSCTAPGYQPQYDLFYDFEGSDHGFTFGGQNSSWAWGEFTSGPGYAISGTKGIATNPAGQYNNSELSWAMSPLIGIASFPPGTVVVLEWWNWLYTESATSTWDVASVEFSKDGTTWTTVWGPYPRQDTAYKQERVIIDESYYGGNFYFRFWFKSDYSGLRDGWYIDDIGIAVVQPTNPPIPVASYSFDDDAGEEEWTTGSSGSGANSWAKGVPTSGPGAAYSAPNVWATNLSGDYNSNEVSYITSPVMDLSAYAGKGVVVEWMDWLRTESATYNWDVGRLYASNDGGATFNLIEDNIKRQDTVGGAYKAQRRELPSDYATAGFQFRFEFKSDYSGNRPGWYIDDVEFSVADPIAVPCGLQDGGIVAGWVYDLNVADQDIPILGALVETADASDTTQERPYDSDNDGLYYFFQPTDGSEFDLIQFTVSKDKYGTVNEGRWIMLDSTNRADFRIGSGWIVADPTALERNIFLYDDDEHSILTLENIGAADGSFEIIEVDYGFEPLYQPAPKPTISIPAFTGEIPPSDEPASIFRDPKLTDPYEGPLTLELSPNAAKFGITQAPAATAAELLSDTLWHWPDLTLPTTYENRGSTGAATYLFAGDFLGGDYSKLYAISYNNGNMYTVDTETAAATEIGYVTRPSGTTYSGLTGANGFFYGVATACGTRSVLTKVFTDASMEEIGQMTGPTCMIDIVYIPSENMLYGVDLVTDSLWMIDPETAVASEVGSLGVNANYAQGMDYDEVNDVIYWASYHSIPELRVIDRTTGASTSIGAFPSGTEIDSYAIHAYGGGGGGAIFWLDEDPVDGVINAGDSMDINLTWSVKDIDQPGDYFGELRIKTDTPIEVPPIPVTLHVWRPYNYGNIKGTVEAYEKCDINPAPAAEATVNFYRDGELHKSTVTGDDGYYSYALLAGTYDVEFVLDGQVTGRVDGVVLGNSVEVFVDFTLRHDSPCLTYTPDFVYQELYPDQMAEQTLTFTNIGAQDAVFEITEILGDGPVPYAYGSSPNPGNNRHVPPRQLNIPEYTGPDLAVANPTTEAKPNALAPVPGATIQLNENAAQYGITEVVPAYAAHLFPSPQTYAKFPDVSVPGTWTQFGTPEGKIYAGDFLGDDFTKFYVIDNDAKTLKTVDVETGAHTTIGTISTPSGNVTGMAGADGFFYATTSNCGSDSTLFKIHPNGDTETIGTISSASCAIDIAYIPSENMLYVVDLVTAALHKFAPDNPGGSTQVGSGLGYSPKYAQGMDYDEINGILYWAACSDNDYSELRIIDTVSGNSVKVGDHPSGELDAFSIAGSSAGGGVPGDIPWLEEDPTAGVVFADGGVVDVTLTFDSTGLVWGDYFGALSVANAPDPKFTIPVQLRILPFNYMYMPMILLYFPEPVQ